MIAKMIALDWRAMKCYQKRFPVVLMPAFIIGFSSPLLALPTCVIMFLFFSINPFAVEEKGTLNILYLTLPVKRSSIVTGRFTLSLIMALCGVLMGTPIMYLSNRFGLSHYYGPLSWYVFILALSYLLYAFLNLMMFPILFKLGYIKGKFGGFYLPLILFGLLYILYSIITSLPGNETLVLNLLMYVSEHVVITSGGIAIAATIFLCISYAASVRLYSKRDL